MKGKEGTKESTLQERINTLEQEVERLTSHNKEWISDHAWYAASARTYVITDDQLILDSKGKDRHISDLEDIIKELRSKQ